MTVITRYTLTGAQVDAACRRSHGSLAGATWRTETIFEQLGGLGLRGALTYTGATQITFKDEDNGTPLPSRIENGYLFAECYVAFRPNAGRRRWKLIVTLEPSDTYTVRLLRLTQYGTVAEVLDECEDVYCEDLQRITEQMYDDAIKRHLGGFIPI